ncbi:hypothetical protein CHN50_02215 [Priestia aryabhattai]|nr:hypothetical protein CHN50_02215 [Priestia aryabhattai]
MVLSFYEESTRGRKAYKDEAGTVYLECTSCKAIKPEFSFQKQSYGFLSRRYNCFDCRSKQNKEYRLKGAMAK